MCVGFSAAQHNLPNYFQGSFNIPNAPIPQPGAYQHGGAPAGSYQPQAAAHLAAARPQYAAAPQSPQYAPAAAYGGHARPVPAAAAPVNAVPSSYGWNVQHSSPQPQPQLAAPSPAQAPVPAAYAQPQHRPYAAAPQPQAPQYAVPQAPAHQYGAAPGQYAAPQPQYARAASPALSAPAPQAPASPVSAALLRPASVHYANIGETLNGDYKFGYRTGNGDSFREETRAPDGTVQGQYGFVDADGKERIVKYTAGVNGFQVLNDGAAPAPAAAAAPAAPQQYAPQQYGQQHGASPQQWG
ncbi:hypothetical protein RDWZM_005016 [Blomia tropicalis]|uniref:Uncharacterized protein n=1 Tax=Blomia tropicalis TaxID=40697 RepID=A0A9Q0RLY0_BLOTA|nr:hypothetical protein RDWZM_005016 [Blomia tropicalis]